MSGASCNTQKYVETKQEVLLCVGTESCLGIDYIKKKPKKKRAYLNMTSNFYTGPRVQSINSRVEFGTVAVTFCNKKNVQFLFYYHYH